jgi:septum formation protein
MKPPLRLILASSSPQRRRLLAEAGFQFEVVPPDESAECGICSTGGPAALVVELAVNKAADVVAQLKHRGDVAAGALILACDTVAECGGEVLGKPHDEAHARGMLERLRGSVHRVYSGLCLWQLSGEGESADPDVRLAMSEHEMDPISDAELEEYLDSGLWEGKAGAFGYQDRVGWLHLRRGTEENVIGLPIDLVVDMLAARGVSPQRRAQQD